MADNGITPEQIQALLDVTVSAVAVYRRAFCRLVYGDDLTAAEAIAEIEMALQRQ